MQVPSNITTVPFPSDTGFVNKETQKDQIFIHHTAGEGDPYSVVKYWISQKNKVATSFIIARGNGKNYKDGDIIQCFPSKYWAWHLGLTSAMLVHGGRNNTDMNSKAVGIELCNWGYLTEKNGEFITYAGTKVPASEVITYDTPYRGYKYYHKYTDAQLESTRNLIKYLAEKYNIPTEFKGMEMFDIDKRCLMGEPGIWNVRVRKDKFDWHPQPNAIEILKSL